MSPLIRAVALALTIGALSNVANATTTRGGMTFHHLQDAELAVLRHAVRNGRPPTTEEGLASVKAADGSALTANRLEDAWSEPVIYRYPSADPSRIFDLYSKGANRIDDGGSGDDVVAWEYRKHYYATNRTLEPFDLIMYAALVDGPVIILVLAGLWLLRRRRRAQKERVGA